LSAAIGTLGLTPPGYGLSPRSGLDVTKMFSVERCDGDLGLTPPGYGLSPRSGLEMLARGKRNRDGQDGEIEERSQFSTGGWISVTGYRR
jgi:hypothetical protein